MNPFICCLNKDRLEFIRTRLNIICPIILLGCAAMVLLSTAYMPYLLDRAMEVTDLMSTDMSISSFMEKFFPRDLKGSLGIFSSDIGVFYSLAIIFLTHALLPTDISLGRFILPLCAGHTENSLFLSKQLVYSFLCAVPVFPCYMLYYYIGVLFLENNYSINSVVFNALMLSIAEFSIVYITIALSVLYKHKRLSLLTMAIFVMVAPDLLSFFKFGSYLPTYIFTYLYRSENNIKKLLFPALSLLLVLVIIDAIIMRRPFIIHVDDRR